MKLAFLLLPALALAQDTRNVTEPVIPAVGATLTAKLTAPLKDADEAMLDSRRIQEAIDHCAKGQAVELKLDGSANAFLSGPLELAAALRC